MDGLFFWIPCDGSTDFNPIAFRFEDTPSRVSSMEGHPAEKRIRCSGEKGSSEAVRNRRGHTGWSVQRIFVSLMEVFRMQRSFSNRKLIRASFVTISMLLFAAGSAWAAEGLTVIPNWSFLLQMANFIFLIWVLNLILYKPIRNVLKKRQEKVTGLEESIESFQKDVGDKQEAFNAGLRSARVKGLEQKESLLAEAAGEEKKIIGQINEKAQAELSQVREQVAKDVEVARQTLLKEVDGFAEAIGEKILGRAV